MLIVKGYYWNFVTETLVLNGENGADASNASIMDFYVEPLIIELSPKKKKLKKRLK